MFDFFNQSSRAFAKRAQALLQEARFAQLEHEAAAEHHHALAKMYADRTPLRVLTQTGNQAVAG